MAERRIDDTYQRLGEMGEEMLAKWQAREEREAACVQALEGLNPAALAALVEAAEAARNRIWCLEAGAIAEGKTELAQKFESWANELSTALTAIREPQHD